MEWVIGRYEKVKVKVDTFTWQPKFIPTGWIHGQENVTHTNPWEGVEFNSILDNCYAVEMRFQQFWNWHTDSVEPKEGTAVMGIRKQPVHFNENEATAPESVGMKVITLNPEYDSNFLYVLFMDNTFYVMTGEAPVKLVRGTKKGYAYVEFGVRK